MKKILLIIMLILFAGINMEAQRFQPKFFCFEDAFYTRHKDSLDFQYTLVSKLGFDGMEIMGLKKMDEKLAMLDKYNLQLFMVYIGIDIDSKPHFDTLLYDFIKKVKNKGVTLWLYIHSKKYGLSDPAGDEVCVPILQELADYSKKYGVNLALYPHARNWLEKVGDGIRLTKKANKPNIGAVFNLCHYLAKDDRPALEKTLKEAIPYLAAVSINGADDGNTNALPWDRLILPLGQGSFDVLKILRILKDNNYKGPIGLQCWDIPGDPAVYLPISMEAWKKYMKQL
jgi:sugar phosphate isomerase/epimerase